MKVGLFALLMMTVAFAGLSHAGKQTPHGRAVGSSISYTDDGTSSAQPLIDTLLQRRRPRRPPPPPPPRRLEGRRAANGQTHYPPPPPPPARQQSLASPVGRKSPAFNFEQPLPPLPAGRTPSGLPSPLARRRQSPPPPPQEEHDQRRLMAWKLWQIKTLLDRFEKNKLPKDKLLQFKKAFDDVMTLEDIQKKSTKVETLLEQMESANRRWNKRGSGTPSGSPSPSARRRQSPRLSPQQDQDIPAYAEVRKHNDGIVYTSVTIDERTPPLPPLEERKPAETLYAEINHGQAQLKCRRRRDASGSCVQDSYKTEVKHVAIGNDVTGNIFVSAVIRTTGKFQIAAKCARTGKVLSSRSYFWPRIEDPHTFPALHIDGTFFGRSLVIQITMPDGGVRNFRYIPKRTLSASLQARFNRKRSAIVGKISFSGNLVDRVYLSLYQSGATTQLVKRFVFFAIDEPNPYALDGKFPPLVPGMTYHLAVDSFLAGRVQTLRYTVQR